MCEGRALPLGFPSIYNRLLRKWQAALFGAARCGAVAMATDAIDTHVRNDHGRGRALTMVVPNLEFAEVMAWTSVNRSAAAGAKSAQSTVSSRGGRPRPGGDFDFVLRMVGGCGELGRMCFSVTFFRPLAAPKAGLSARRAACELLKWVRI